MKLRNKKTGKIGYTAVLRSKAIFIMDENAIKLAEYTSLAELNEEWEDYEEPKEYYAIDLQGDIIRWARHSWDEGTTNKIKQIGNYFETKEEAEKAVEKLKAWKRLRDKGFKFDIWENDQSRALGDFIIYASIKCIDDIVVDLDLLFGCKE